MSPFRATEMTLTVENNHSVIRRLPDLRSYRYILLNTSAGKDSQAHCYETGGMRRTHLRGRENILKRQLIHVCAFNLSLIFRQLLGAGTPRELKKQSRGAFAAFIWLQIALPLLRDAEKRDPPRQHRLSSARERGCRPWHHCRKIEGCTTGS
jgi:hypothetical protein